MNSCWLLAVSQTPGAKVDQIIGLAWHGTEKTRLLCCFRNLKTVIIAPSFGFMLYLETLGCLLLYNDLGVEPS